MAGLPDPKLDQSTRRLINDFRVNNFILFTRNVKNPDQLTKLCSDLIDTCRQAGLNPPLIAIDQEGGSVTRLGPPFTQFPDARLLAESEDPTKGLFNYAKTCAQELRRVGINLNFAPVLDVCPRGENFFMERRSLGEDPVIVARFGRLIIEEMQNNGIAACAKHFPGLGGAILDPHKVLPTVNRTAEQMAEDLLPFREAVAGGVASIMTSHTIYPALDPDNPATLSKKILTDILRSDIGYDGVIVTDDLEMGAIEQERPLAEAALISFKAGADLLLICHEHPKVINTLTLLNQSLAKGEITTEQLRTSGQRIAALQQSQH
ncbi:MAG: beta-N-acetylhexosaminidase [Proteobacteria bacterium]|nr:beta-N-acetylhexosaminidase [Pseudomonadota bacterium]MBU1717133.1 beta-N-acetylhexosaminidase [Pseudomonadota bacterium]